jgi:hypothetical protein
MFGSGGTLTPSGAAVTMWSGLPILERLAGDRERWLSLRLSLFPVLERERSRGCAGVAAAVG